MEEGKGMSDRRTGRDRRQMIEEGQPCLNARTIIRRRAHCCPPPVHNISGGRQ